MREDDSIDAAKGDGMGKDEMTVGKSLGWQMCPGQRGWGDHAAWQHPWVLRGVPSTL